VLAARDGNSNTPNAVGPAVAGEARTLLRVATIGIGEEGEAVRMRDARKAGRKKLGTCSSFMADMLPGDWLLSLGS